MRALLPLLLFAACGLPQRVKKSLLAPDFVTDDAPAGAAAAVTYRTGDGEEPPVPYRPTTLDAPDGRRLQEAVEITSAGWIEVAPTGGPVELRVYTRSRGLARHDFTQVRSVTGAVDRAHPDEIRFLPERISTPYRLSLGQLTNVYNDYDLADGDLLLVEARAGEAEPERYLFKINEFGPRFKYSGGFLVTVPLRVLAETQPSTAAPVLAFTTALGYRFRTRSPVLRWFGGNSALVVSIGVGSTALDAPALDEPLEDQLVGHFTATVVGGGLEFYDFVSLQALVNASAAGRDLDEAPWVLAIGFDAVRFGLFTRDLGTRLFRRNTLDEEPARGGEAPG